MIYKGYELSRSLNGNSIVFIGRNAAGAVVFREQSENRLKRAIDKAIEDRERQAQQLAKEKEAQERAKSRKKGFVAKQKKGKSAENKPLETTIATPKIRRDSTGKFISQSQEKQEKKESFWEKLKG